MSVVHSRRVHDERIVVLPAAYRVAVVRRVECPSSPACSSWERLPHPSKNFAPQVHVLKQDDYPVGHRGDRESASFGVGVRRKSKRITISRLRGSLAPAGLNFPMGLNS